MYLGECLYQDKFISAPVQKLKAGQVYLYIRLSRKVYNSYSTLWLLQWLHALIVILATPIFGANFILSLEAVTCIFTVKVVVFIHTKHDIASNSMFIKSN